MNVEVLAVGTELLLGQIVNGNAADIGQRLAEAGLDHYRQTVVGDNLDRVTAAIREIATRSDALIITGASAPPRTTSPARRCDAAGVAMEFSDEYAAHLRDWWGRRGREMPATNLRQAEYPTGAVLIPNDKGTAPGLRLRIGGCWVFALPGVPEEMLPMVDAHVVPFLVAEAGAGAGVIVSRLLRTWGESESRIAEVLGISTRRTPTRPWPSSPAAVRSNSASPPERRLPPRPKH